LVAADAVAAVLRTIAADSAIIILIDIFRLLVRSGVIAALLSTQTPAASDHSINHEGLRIAPENGCSFAALHMSAYGTSRQLIATHQFGRYRSDGHAEGVGSVSI
jgi:hypothetical protein